MSGTIRVTIPGGLRSVAPQVELEIRGRLARVAGDLGLAELPVQVDTSGDVEPTIEIAGVAMRWSRATRARARMSFEERLLVHGAVDERFGDVPLETAASWIAALVEAVIVERPACLVPLVAADVAREIEMDDSITAWVLTELLDSGVGVSHLDHEAVRGVAIGATARWRERVISKQHPRSIKIELSLATLTRLLAEDPRRDAKPFALLASKIERELGLHVPTVQLIPTDSVREGQVRIRVNELAELPQPLVPPKQALYEGGSTYVPWWKKTMLIGPENGDGPSITALDHLALELFDVIARRASRLVEATEVDRWVGSLDKAPLAANARASRYYDELPRILRRLLAERVSIADLPRILDRLVDFHEMRTPPPRTHVVLTRGFPVNDDRPAPEVRLLESIRFALGGAILTSIVPTGDLSVLVLAPSTERLLLDEATPETAARLVHELREKLAHASIDALLTTVEIRARVRNITADVFPDLPVLSFQELPPSASLYEEGRIEIGPKTTTRVKRPMVTSASDVDGVAPLLATLDKRAAFPSLFAGAITPDQPRELLRRSRAFATDTAAPPGDIRAQGWGVLAPAGKRGDELLAAIDPLVKFRTQVQGSTSYLYRTERGDDVMSWVRDNFESKPENLRPRYLLVLGNPSEVSIDLQRALAPLAGVGRLDFDDDAHYTAYAEKAIASEGRRRAELRASVYFGDDGSPATAKAETNLIAPCMRAFQELVEERLTRLSNRELFRGGKEELVKSARQAELLFTVSHGLGDKMSYADRTKQQGALLAGDDLFTAADVANGEFLSGGLWMMLACYGLGTPQLSVFRPWIKDLYSRTSLAEDQLAKITAGELLDSEAPFTAALPKMALANPEGPLAVIGHMDMAWSYSYMQDGQPRFDRLFESLRSMLRELPVGYALEKLMQQCVYASDQLTALYEHQTNFERGAVSEALEPQRIPRAWMLRQDLRGYMLLGDPAVRLRTESK
jgi:hypothetical protein